jgi:hypothetical protein
MSEQNTPLLYEMNTHYIHTYMASQLISTNSVNTF